MTRHERYAAKQGYTLVKIQGRVEWWTTHDGKPKLYNKETKRWSNGRFTV